MSRFEFTVTEEQQDMRIDKFLADVMKDVSRSQIQLWIKDGHVLLNDAETKSNVKIEIGDHINVSIPEAVEIEAVAENIPLDVVYEDEDVIVVNKPRGMVVHPAPGHPNGTLVNALLYHCTDLPGINGEIRPGIVHRIDKDTSGLLMVAKTSLAHESLVDQLKAKTTKRIYQAIAHGVIHHEHGTIDAPIGRDKRDRQSMAVTDDNGREAVTHFTVHERFENYSYITCQLETGRTHQIRVHMKYIGHPVAGDPKYGPKKTLDIKGQALHASVLGFTHPRTGEEMRFEAPMPEDMQIILKKLQDSR